MGTVGTQQPRPGRQCRRHVNDCLARGDERCDYAPGDWLLEVDAEPVIDGVTLPRQDIAKVPLTVPLEEGGALAWRSNSDTRFCSFTAAVYTRQGEPTIDR